MAYIGKIPTSGSFTLLDSISTSATASYTMQKNSVNFEPQSANHMIVSLNGTIQAPVSSFTVSGSTLTFASALTSSDVIDFILVLGNVNDVGTATTVVDSAITKNKTDFITDGSSAGVTVKGSGSDSGSIALNCSSNSHAIQLISPDHSAGQSYKLKLPDNNVTADKFIKVKSITGSGATATGQLEFADAGGGNMSPSFFAYRNGTQTASENTWTKIQINTEVYDEGSNYDHSTNYRFTPTTAGKFFVYGQSLVYANGQTDINYSQLKVYKNGSEHLLGENDFRGSRPYGIQSNVQGVVDMNGSSDYLELYVRQSSNSQNTNYIQGNSTRPTHFGAFKIIT